MGDEADADWQDGLVEWGIEDTQRWMAEKLDAAMMKAVTGGRRGKPRQTALRVRGRGFETVEIDDAGKIIEPPPRCCYGVGLHAPNCKSWGIT